MYGGKIPVAQAELQAHKLQCTRELRELHEALRVTLSDSEVEADEEGMDSPIDDIVLEEEQL